jgi:hypothetical protein
MRKMGVMTVIVEDLEPAYATVADECSALYRYYGKNRVEITVSRFTFLSCEVGKLVELKTLKDSQFLSSCILINFRELDGDWISYIYQAFITKPVAKLQCDFNESGVSKNAWLPLLNNYLHIQKDFQCEVGMGKRKTRNFSIKGTFFCQQNTVTSVCAHAAICMTINNMHIDEGNTITPEDINGKLDIDHQFKKLKLGRDFHKKDFKTIFQDYGLSVTSRSFSGSKNRDYDAYTYRYVESRCPTLLVFTTDDEKVDHVIPVLGHTLNTDLWTPEAQITYSKPKTLFDIYRSTSLWADHFVIHDDNLGMYYCLPTHVLKQPFSVRRGYAFKAKYAISVIPEGVKTPSREVEWAAASVLDQMFSKLIENRTKLDDWTERLIRSYRDTLTPRVVAMRTFLSSKEDYEHSLAETDFEGNRFSDEDKKALVKHLPERFWLSEITMPDIFTANKNKVIDFFYCCDKHATNDTSKWNKRWIQVRLPGALRVNTREPSSASMSVKSHYPLMRFEKDAPAMEW